MSGIVDACEWLNLCIEQARSCTLFTSPLSASNGCPRGWNDGLESSSEIELTRLH